MVYTRAKIRSEGKEAEVEEAERKRPDPKEIEREANKRKRLHYAPPAGSAPTPKRRKAPTSKGISLSRHKRKTRAAVEEVGDASSASAVPKAVDEPLQTFRDQKAYQGLLHEKLRQLVSKRDQKQLLLRDSFLHHAVWSAESEGEMEGFVPQNDEKKRAYRQYLHLGDMIRDIRARLGDVDAILTFCSERLVEILLETYGRKMSSVDGRSDRFPILEQYDVASSEGGAGDQASGDLPEHLKHSTFERPERFDQQTTTLASMSTLGYYAQQPTGRPNQPTEEDQTQDREKQQSRPFADQGDHRESGPELSPLLARQAGPSPETADDPAGRMADSLESSEQFRNPQVMAERARRIARERVQSKRNMFDQFWPSYQDYKREWQRQRDAGETNDNQSVLDRAFIEEGQHRTQILINAERDYRRAAWDARDLNVEVLSPNQTSLFPTDDGVDQEGLDRDREDIESGLDRVKICKWIQEEWQHGYPHAFDSPEAMPVQHPDPGAARSPSGGLPALPQVPYGSCVEEWAVCRQRVRIDLWGKWTCSDWQAMLQEWPAMSSNRQEIRISPPYESPQPDTMRLPTNNAGEDDPSAEY